MLVGSSVEINNLSVEYPALRPMFRWRTPTAQRVHDQQRRLRALHDVTLTIRPGERVGVVGLNGAGKSTLFRTIAGVLTPARGSVNVGGYAAGSPHRLPVGFMATHPLIYRRLTGYENLRYVADLYHVPDAETRIGFLAEKVGILDVLPAYVEQYSTGMVARLDFARTLLPDPPLLLLDEPFGSFDVRFAEEARRTIRETNATVLLATHNLTDIEKLTHRLILLHRGRVVRDVAFEDLSEVAPVREGKQGVLTITEFVELLLRRSLAHEPPLRDPLHRKYVLSP